MSNDGQDQGDCPLEYLPCNNLKHVLSQLIYFDEIRIYSKPDVSHIFELCWDKPVVVIDKPIHITGVGHPAPVLTCTERGDAPLLNLASFSDQYLTEPDRFQVTNIAFENVDIVLRDAELVIEDCTFTNASIFAMAPELRRMFYAKTSTEDSAFNAYNDFAFFGGPEPGANEGETCSWANLVVKTSWWAFVPQSLEGFVLDAPNTDGIKVKCITAEVSITETIFNNQLLDIQTREPAIINLVKTTIQGVENETLVPGGLAVVSYNTPQINIENCSFVHLTFGDVALEVFSTFVVGTRAVFTWQTFTYVSATPVIYDQTRINISHTLFAHNTRAIEIEILDEYSEPATLNLTNTHFHHNEGTADGGALIFSSNIKPLVVIERCIFTQNAAGVVPFSKPFLNQSYVLSTTMQLYFVGYAEVEMDNHLRLFLLRGTEQRHELFKHQISGSGGAIYIAKAIVKISACRFINNTASLYGGAILVTQEGQLNLSSVAITVSSGDSRVVPFVGDAIFSSQISLNLYQVTVQVISVSGATKSTIQHQNAQRIDSVAITDLNLMCPETVSLYVQTTSVDAFADEERSTDTVQPFTYNHLLFHCKPCRQGEYTLYSGQLALGSRKVLHSDASDAALNASSSIVKHRTSTTAERDPGQGFNFTQASCTPCPFGGICDGHLSAKPNYWGAASRGVVKMYKCPASYCCTGSCTTYNQCASHRTGTLCGRCKPGYTEAMFSTKCIPENECRDQWFLVVLLFFTLLYTIFLLFQSEFKTFLVGKPLGKSNFRRNQVVKFDDPNKQDSVESVKKDEGGVFLILLFYYFQDASIIQFVPIYRNKSPELDAIIRNLVSGLFKFQLNVLNFAKSVCIFTHTTPVGKQIVNLFSVPIMWLILTFIYCLLRLIHRKRKLAPVWFNRCIVALMLSVLFSYQKILATSFKMIYCVVVQDKKVLFLDGNIECFTLPQYAVCAFVSTCVIPFVVYLTLAPGYLQQGQLSILQFYLGFLFPIPVVLYLMCKRSSGKPVPDQSPSHALNALLQGPYKPLYFPGTRVSLCWSGVVLYRRLALIIVSTFVRPPLHRLSTMFLICLAAQLLHVSIQPCKERRANLSGTVSCTALLAIAAMNTVKAGFESMEVIPTGGTLSIMNTFETIENCLLVWIPLAGICLLICVLLWRLLPLVLSKCKSH